MLYPFECQECGNAVSLDCRPLHPPNPPLCCGAAMLRIYGCQINTSSCRDANHIPANKRVVRSGLLTSKKKFNAEVEERKFRQHIEQRRQELRGQQKGSFQHTHSVPADLYHGKIRETGDKHYWSDPSNVARHKDCKVS